MFDRLLGVEACVTVVNVEVCSEEIPKLDVFRRAFGSTELVVERVLEVDVCAAVLIVDVC